MEALHYPMAGETKRFLEERREREQNAMAQQAAMQAGAPGVMTPQGAVQGGMPAAGMQQEIVAPGMAAVRT